MFFVVSAGGTAGHINPAIAVADELRSRGHEILFVGTPDHIESKLAVEAGFEFMGLSVAGFDKSRPWTLLTSTLKIARATSAVVKRFEQRRPDAVATFGAYVSIPVGRAAAQMGIPLVVHEQNSVAGMANRYLAKKASIMALTYEQSRDALQGAQHVEVTGNPVRASFDSCSKSAGRTALGIPDEAMVLLVFGGSLGAKHLNSAICDMKERLLATEGLYVIHSTGAKDFEAVAERLALDEQERERWRLMSYIDNMGDVLAASDLVVSRAGASSLAEIMTVGVPSVLVPYPYARGDHQTLNAASCVEAGAARLVADADVDDPAFSEMVMELLSDGAQRATMAAACAKLSGSNARVRLADLTELSAQEA